MNSVIYPHYMKLIETCLNVPENHSDSSMASGANHSAYTLQLM